MSAFDKEKTVTDLQFVDMLEKDYAVRQAKFSTWYQSNGDMGLFNTSYFWWKKSFRGFYSETYLIRSGFVPNTDVSKTTFDDDLLLAYLQTVNADIINVNTKSIGLASATQVSREHMQDNAYSFSNNTEILIYGENTYETFNANFDIDAGTTTINMHFSDGYKTTEPDTLVDPLEIQITNPYSGVTTFNASIEYGSSPSPEWYMYIEDAATIPTDTYVIEAFIMTAIIPIKENNVFSKETLYLKRFLNKMGLGGKDLVDSLTTTEEGEPSPVDNAYIMEGLPFNSTNQAVIMALFKSFEYVAESGGSSVNLNMSALNMSYNFDVSIVTHPGELNEGVDHKNRPIYAVSEIIVPEPPPPPDGTKGLFPPNMSAESELIIKYQEIPGEYMEMTVSNYIQTFNISGYGFRAYLDSEPEEGRLIVPLEVLNDLSFREYVPVHEHAFCLIAYAIETTTIKWYQRIAGFVIGIILGVIFGPAGMTLWQLIVNAVINAVIALAVSFVLAAIDNPWITAIVGVIMVLYGQLGNLDLSQLTLENFLPIANSVIDGASTIYADMVKEEMEKLAKEAEEQAKKDKEKMDELKPGIDVAKIMMDALYSFEDATNASLWIENQLGTNLFNFDQYYDVNKEVEMRKQVVAG